MFGFGAVDIDNDRDDMLIMTVSSLYNGSMPKPRFRQKGADESWLNGNIHKDLIKICHKYKDKKWIKRGQHRYLIYYALHIIGTMCLQIGSKAAKSILDEKAFIDTLLSIYSNNMHKTTNWFEARAAARTISVIIANAPDLAYKFVNNTKNINIIDVAMRQYAGCVRYVIKTYAVAPSKIKGYVQDLMLKINGFSHCYDDDILRPLSIQMAQHWMSFNGTMLSALSSNLNDDIIELFNNIDIKLWEKACGIDVCWQFITKEGKAANGDKCIDALRKLSKFKNFAKKISHSDILIKSFILNLRSRSPSILGLRFDLIIENILKYKLLDRKYYKDLCLSLLLLLEYDRKYIYYEFESKPIAEIVINCLILLFNIPEIRYIEPMYIKKFNCSRCNNLVIDPYKTNCKHHYCYICMLKNKINSDTFKCQIKKCQKTFYFASKEDEKFDYKTFNTINSAKCKVIIDDDNICIDTMSECWKFIKNNLKNIYMDNELNEEFNYFCDYMIKGKSVKSVKELKKLRIEARNIKDSGNKYFKNKQYSKAINNYHKSIKLCPNIFCEDRCCYYSNLALSYIKLNDYFNAYKYCLFGLSANFDYLKLLNVLEKCYKNLNVNELFENIDIINNDYLNKVQNIIWCNFNNIFRTKYMSVKLKQMDIKMDINECKAEDIEEKWKHFEKNDVFFKYLHDSMKEHYKSSLFIDVYFKLYDDKYQQFKRNKKMAKKEIYKFLVYVLSHKTEFWIYENDQDLQNEEWIFINDLLEEINDNFYLEDKLFDIDDEIKQKHLISGYAGYTKQKQSISIKSDKIPKVIIQLIQKFLFCLTKYDFYKIDEWGIHDIVKKSKYLTLSKKCLTDSYSIGEYGVKLTDLTESYDPYWKQIELIDNDSGIDEFRSNVD